MCRSSRSTRVNVMWTFLREPRPMLLHGNGKEAVQRCVSFMFESDKTDWNSTWQRWRWVCPVDLPAAPSLPNLCLILSLYLSEGNCTPADFDTRVLCLYICQKLPNRISASWLTHGYSSFYGCCCIILFMSQAEQTTHPIGQRTTTILIIMRSPNPGCVCLRIMHIILAACLCV